VLLSSTTVNCLIDDNLLNLNLEINSKNDNGEDPFEVKELELVEVNFEDFLENL
jgi:hypothetical protein